jgi:hypothetical protein
MHRRGLGYAEILDRIGVRIVVQNIDHCIRVEPIRFATTSLIPSPMDTNRSMFRYVRTSSVGSRCRYERLVWIGNPRAVTRHIRTTRMSSVCDL